MNNPLVAIVTPVYNGARFLRETLECVQAQTYAHVTHIVLDNASTDDTAEIIAQFRQRRIPLVVARNSELLPQLDNWNTAMRLIPSEASYFRVLPADDLLAPDGIEKMVAIGEQYREAGLVCCQESVKISSASPVENTYIEAFSGTDLPGKFPSYDGRSLIRASLLHQVSMPYHHSLFRRPPGGLRCPFYDTTFYDTPLLCADADAAMRVLTEAPCAFIHEPLAITRWHESAVTSTQMLPNKIRLWSWLQLIDRWGPIVFETEREFLKCRRKHLQLYYRHMLMWRACFRRRLVSLHAEWLSNAKAQPNLHDYVTATLEWLQRSGFNAFRRVLQLSNMGYVKPIHFGPIQREGYDE